MSNDAFILIHSRMHLPIMYQASVYGCPYVAATRKAPFISRHLATVEHYTVVRTARVVHALLYLLSRSPVHYPINNAILLCSETTTVTPIFSPLATTSVSHRFIPTKLLAFWKSYIPQFSPRTRTNRTRSRPIANFILPTPLSTISCTVQSFYRSTLPHHHSFRFS